MTTTKKELRHRLASLPPPERAARRAVVDHVSEWIEQRGPGVVVGFLAMGEEIDMSPLVDRHRDVRFALTRTAPGTTLTVHPFDAPRERHRLGFEQPSADAPVVAVDDIDVVLVPGVAFTPEGHRLGRGAGYYDRFLASVEAETVALTVDARVVEALPVEPHDVPVGWVATESGVHRAGSPDPS